MKDQTLLEGVVVCPGCGYSPAVEAKEHNREVKAKGLPAWILNYVPETREESLDFYEVGGADENCIFCPECSIEFNPDTGMIAEIDLDATDTDD